MRLSASCGYITTVWWDCNIKSAKYFPPGPVFSAVVPPVAGLWRDKSASLREARRTSAPKPAGVGRRNLQVADGQSLPPVLPGMTLDSLPAPDGSFPRTPCAAPDALRLVEISRGGCHPGDCSRLSRLPGVRTARPRKEARMTLNWIAERLHLGAAGSWANLLRDAGRKRQYAIMRD